ncbi:MAG: radical SAM protein [Acidobacteria bacterium]|nr:radical SAM protein [Acidobacteriota bacterium]NIM64102.1 radical SAM protein [Acidobacteriota bacterium]NIO59402.1 radical SAM protein [Acidobacteriota bacterium]NIQ30436.1 radical SAM protein [Acidobacteriota bacterium]NIQ85368.1 radical SAM protein [Acidobacteriota bacterium]
MSGFRVTRTPREVDRRFLIRDFEPAYRATHERNLFAAKVQAGLEELEDCCACPRNCHVNRLQERPRVCNTGRHAIVSSAFAHFGEEDCLRGWNGSGTIFFGLCNLRCVFCQNWDISQQQSGRECSGPEIADLMLRLQDNGCHNINLVTPEHVVPQVVEAIAEAVPRGLSVPIVYNTSAYDSLESLKLMEGLVDIYMPDFKFFSYEPSRRYLKAKDYPERAREAIREMHRQVGDLRFGPDGLARRGLLVRHLVMPSHAGDARKIFEWLAAEISPDTYVNVMDQYRPTHRVGPGEPRYGAINRRVGKDEVAAAFAAAREAGLWRFDERWL